MGSSCRPIVWLLTISTNGVLRLMGIDPNSDEEEVSEEPTYSSEDLGQLVETCAADEIYEQCEVYLDLGEYTTVYDQLWTEIVAY